MERISAACAGLERSSASINRIQSASTASSAALRCEAYPFQAWNITSAPDSSAKATVRSSLPESNTTTRSVQRTLSMQARICASSLRVRMTAASGVVMRLQPLNRPVDFDHCVPLGGGQFAALEIAVRLADLARHPGANDPASSAA